MGKCTNANARSFIVNLIRYSNLAVIPIRLWRFHHRPTSIFSSYTVENSPEISRSKLSSDLDLLLRSSLRRSLRFEPRENDCANFRLSPQNMASPSAATLPVHATQKFGKGGHGRLGYPRPPTV